MFVLLVQQILLIGKEMCHVLRIVFETTCLQKLNLSRRIAKDLREVFNKSKIKIILTQLYSLITQINKNKSSALIHE
jgi:hypothetical protein